MVALPEFRIIYIGILLRLKRKAGDDEEADKEDDASQVKVTDKDLQRQLRRVHLDVNISVAIHVFRCLLSATSSTSLASHPASLSWLRSGSD